MHKCTMTTIKSCQLMFNWICLYYFLQIYLIFITLNRDQVPCTNSTSHPVSRNSHIRIFLIMKLIYSSLKLICSNYIDFNRRCLWSDFVFTDISQILHIFNLVYLRQTTACTCQLENINILIRKWKNQLVSFFVFLLGIKLILVYKYHYKLWGITYNKL